MKKKNEREWAEEEGEKKTNCKAMKFETKQNNNNNNKWIKRTKKKKKIKRNRCRLYYWYLLSIECLVSFVKR